ncbi:hypothetical protein [Sulfitobacter mediterraneus]|nr:hypothetical protein [Sulfitobacter mediterraneus]
MTSVESDPVALPFWYRMVSGFGVLQRLAPEKIGGAVRLVWTE